MKHRTAFLAFVTISVGLTFNQLKFFFSVVEFGNQGEKTLMMDKDHPSMGKALECLRLTKPKLPNLSYPRDAFEHFHHIHYSLARWIQHPDHNPHRAKGYSGPWIENHWISHFEKELKSNNYSLPDVFGPYVPILIPWTDIWVKNRYKYPGELVGVIKRLLREDVMYITVNQNDDGFVGRNADFHDIQNMYHITVLSAGGYGHVPVPLFKQPEALIQKVPLNERKYLVSYVGSDTNAPNDMRKKMIAHLDQASRYYYKGSEWRDVMAQSKFSLCPRGFGRTSYHVIETLQMGLVPIQVYLDQPWLPYGNLLKGISFTVRIEEVSDLLLNLSEIPDSKIEKMEAQIELLREDYFTFEGAINQIGKFMIDPTNSELICQTLPSTPR